MSELRFTPEMYDEGIRLATEDLRRQLAEKIRIDERKKTAEKICRMLLSRAGAFDPIVSEFERAIRAGFIGRPQQERITK